MMQKLRRLLVAGPRSGPPALAALIGRLAAGWVFVAFGAGKFTSHASEVRSFTDYGLPAPDAFVYAIGVIEVVGGVLLIAGLATRVAALILAGDMVGAIVLDGIIAGAALSLTLAPALLGVMLFLMWVGPGSHAFDHRADHLLAVPGRG
jgi:putative oxidoreductase